MRESDFIAVLTPRGLSWGQGAFQRACQGKDFESLRIPVPLGLIRISFLAVSDPQTGPDFEPISGN